MLKNIINTVPDPVFVKDDQFRLLYLNQECADSWGLPVSEIIGKNDDDFFSKEERDVFHKNDKKTFETGKTTISEEKFTRIAGNTRIIATKKSVFKTLAGHKILVGVSRDVTEIKEAKESLKKHANELKRKVANRTRQLEAKKNDLEVAIEELKNLNSDLDCFAHICCHELRSPLRTLTNFSKLVLEELDRGETKNIGEYLITIHDRALKMDQLMKSILEYSTSGLNKNAYSTFSIEELLNEITLMLNVQIHEKKAVIIYQNMPTIYADRMQFFQLFQNLINNAIKFSKPSIGPAVTITAKNTPNTIIFQVKDNRLGIAKKYHKELFLPFKKFHTRAEGSQYGIGLSLCKKIVENHGGTIKISSSENAGTTFTFITPINKIVLNNDKI
jgi:PAS domain S-box-containing protein